VNEPLGYRIKFQLPFNNIKWLSDYSCRWQVKGLRSALECRYARLWYMAVSTVTVTGTGTVTITGTVCPVAKGKVTNILVS